MERYKTEVTVTPEMCYADGVIRPDAWFVWLQNSGGDHLEQMKMSRGFGLPDNLAWVLLEVTAKINQVRKAGERLLLETFPIRGTTALFPRRYICRDILGKIVTTADTTWALMDVARRRMTRSAEITDKLSAFEEHDDNLALLSPVEEVSCEPVVETFKPKETDFDVNGHVNNTRYIAWVGDRINKLGGFVNRIHCRYHAEILPGQEALLKLRRTATEFFCEIFSGADNNKLCFAVYGQIV
jgi:acyl-ACP thioesterase